MVFGGIMAIFEGIAAIARDDVFVATPNFTYEFSLTGWGWVQFLGRGDYVNFLGVAALASITLVCYARIVPVLPRLHAALAIIQIAVLLAAALF